MAVQRFTLSPDDAAGKPFITHAMLEEIVAARTAELRAANEALKESEERYHKMVEEVEDYAILLLDKNGIVQNWNKGAEKIKGYQEQEIVGRHFRQFYLPEDQARGLPEQSLQEAAASGKAAYEGWRVRKNGTVFWGSIVLTALHDSNNNIIGFSKVTRDLTDRKNADDKLKETAARLESQNRELEQFAYIAAHDMKEPLRKVRLYTNRVLQSTAANLPGNEKELLVKAGGAISRMQALIDDLLAYSQAAAAPAQFEEVSLEEILADTIAGFQETIRQTSAVIEAGPLPTIHAIPHQMGQLFDNIIGNALKYRYPGRKPCIHITYAMITSAPGDAAEDQPGGVYHAIQFRDNGIGFDPQHAKNIFDAFQRLPATQSYPGTGIGLAICRKIAEVHKGYITAEGHINEGAVITVCLSA